MGNGARPFFGGVPTGPDVERLIEHFGVPGPGLILHADIVAILGIDFRSSRYRCVVGIWRRRLRREHNISTEGVPGEGIRVLAEVERIGKSVRGLRSGTRKIGSAWREVRDVKTEELEPRERARADHTAALVGHVYNASAVAVRELAPPRALPQLPR